MQYNASSVALSKTGARKISIKTFFWIPSARNSYRSIAPPLISQSITLVLKLKNKASSLVVGSHQQHGQIVRDYFFKFSNQCALPLVLRYHNQWRWDIGPASDLLPFAGGLPSGCPAGHFKFSNQCGSRFVLEASSQWRRDIGAVSGGDAASDLLPFAGILPAGRLAVHCLAALRLRKSIMVFSARHRLSVLT